MRLCMEWVLLSVAMMNAGVVDDEFDDKDRLESGRDTADDDG
jgi:hypothetical protein